METTTVTPLPATPLYVAMASGHQNRKGHPLVAHLETSPLGLSLIVRECCK